MFRDASQPVRSNKPIPAVCVIRLLIVIPPTIPEFKLHPATRSQSSSGATFASAGNLTSRGEAPFRGAAAANLKKQVHGHRMFTAQRFRFHFRAARSEARRRGIEKQRAFSCVRSYTQTPNGHARRSPPSTSNCFEQLLRAIASQFSLWSRRFMLPASYVVWLRSCRWEGARWLGVWDA